VIVLDTSVIYALLDRADRRHPESVAWYETVEEDLATTPLVVAEADHLALSRAGAVAARALRRDVASGAYSIEWWPAAPAEMVEIAVRYADLGLGLTDASLVALAERLGTIRIASFDERHFRAVRPSRADHFVLLPLDAA
jgi:uncharacterized protein